MSTDNELKFFNPTTPLEMQQVNSATVAAISADVLKSLKPLFNRLTAEIYTLQNEIKALKNGKEDPAKILPKTPFQCMEEFCKFDQQLNENKDTFSALEQELKFVAVNNGHFVRNCWRKVFDDSLAEKFSWQGTHEKKSVRNLNVALAIRNASVAKGIDEGQYALSTKAFFQFAKNRQKQRNNYKIKCNKENVTAVQSGC